MEKVQYERAERLWLKAHPGLTERWVQNIIEQDPSILGLGNLEVRHSERRQWRSGRLDLLLENSDSTHRFAVEIQLGRTDESHIIRTIEYWAVERNRFPKYKHIAVIIAEDITSRFYNVISLLNGTMPIIALQLHAIKLAGKVTLVFSKVLDHFDREEIDTEEDAESPPTDRAAWASKTPLTMELVDKVFGIIKEISPESEPKYNKYYIGIYHNMMANNFISMKPKQNFLKIKFRIPRNDDIDKIVIKSQLEEYDNTSVYEVKVSNDEFERARPYLKKLAELAYEYRRG